MKKVLVVIVCLLTGKTILGQGCSDPGLCTIGALNTEISKDSVSAVDFTNADMETLLATPFTAEKYRFTLGGVYGSGQEGVDIYTGFLQVHSRLKEKMILSVKIPYTITNGALGSASGLGDITLGLENILYSGKNIRFGYTVGAVLPSGDANMYYEGDPLPMVYQTTLGSLNLLGGLSFAYHNWSASIGYQHSFGRNENDFLTDNLELDPTRPDYDQLNAERIKFPNARRLQRGSDLMFRFERKIKFKSLNIAVGVLPIFRLAESTVLLPSGEENAVAGTAGLTFNTTWGISYFHKNQWIFRLNGGAPLKIRDESADGLIRSVVVIGSVAYRIW